MYCADVGLGRVWSSSQVSLPYRVMLTREMLAMRQPCKSQQRNASTVVDAELTLVTAGIPFSAPLALLLESASQAQFFKTGFTTG